MNILTPSLSLLMDTGGIKEQGAILAQGSSGIKGEMTSEIYATSIDRHIGRMQYEVWV